MARNKDRWSALSMSERADLIKLYVSNGVTSLDDIKKDYNSFTPSKEGKPSYINQSIQESRVNKFGPGGGLNNEGLTLEEYLQAKADSTRMAAFNASELATKGIEIKYPLSEKDRWNNDRVIHNYLYENTSMYSPPRNDEVEEFNSRDEYQYKDLEAEYQQASRENRENCDFGSNCIGTTTSFYPKDSREIQNTEFLKNYEQKGFYQVDEPEKGDIAIAVSASTGHPYHGMIYAGKDVYGNIFNYSRGGVTEEDYRKHAYFPGNHLYFRYKGTPELIQQWTEEYLSKQKAEVNKYGGGGPANYLTNSTASPTQFFDDYLANYTKFSLMPEAPIDEKELVRRQAWAESAGNDKAGSRKGAKGRYQIMPNTLTEYQKATKDIGNIYDPVYNKRVRDWEFNRYKNSDQVNRGEPTDSVKMGRRLAIYNYGYGNTRKALNAAVKAGIDINTSFDWLQKFPKETRDYVNFILRNKDTGSHRTNDAYKKRKK